MNAPVTRRALLGATAAVGAVALPFMAEAGTASLTVDSPDADLFRLLDSYPATLAAMKAAGDRVEALWEAFIAAAPERPDALRVRVADGFNVSQGQYRTRDGGRHWFYEVAATDELRALPSAALECDELRDGQWVTVPDEARIARRAEILAAHDRWWAECDAIKDRLGFPAADDADEQATSALWDLDAAILATAPTTFAGLAAKARWVAQCRLGAMFSADWHRQIVADVVAMAERGGVAS